jgi:dihydroorotate dehydrogenase electron transfer subunit
MDQFITKVLQNKKISPDYYELSFTWPRNLAPKAGHFLTIRTLLNDDPILRRPFAFSAFDKQIVVSIN